MTEHPVSEKEKRILPWLAAVGFFMQALDGTILNTALPSIAADLHESPLQMQAAIISYMLTVAMLIPASGWPIVSAPDAFFCFQSYYSQQVLFSVPPRFH